MGKAQTYAERGIAYARGVVGGSILACKWTRAACQRQLDDLDRWSAKGSKYFWSPEDANRICSFVELMPHIKGEWARRSERIKLEDWQCFILTVVFGWYSTAEKTRRFRTVYIEVPRKNAKSTVSAPVGLYMVAMDGEPGAEVYSAATTRDQAKIVFGIARRMAMGSPGFRNEFGVEVGTHNLYVEESGSKFEALSAEAGSLDGLNVACAVIDELHAHKTRDVWDVIESATGSRSQSLIWAITTAGSNRAGICYEQRTYVTKILNMVLSRHEEYAEYKVEGGSHDDETYFGIIYTIDDTDDWATETAWRKANPNYGVSVYPDDFARLALKAQQMPSATNTFLTKRLNVWVNADSAWMDMRAWDRCADPTLKIESFEFQPCILALDLASKRDICALILLFERRGHYYCFGKYYLPEDAIEESNNSQYGGWVRGGKLIDTPGAATDFEYIQNELRELAPRFQIDEVAYDPFQANQLRIEMEKEGFPMVEVPQQVRFMSEAMKQLEALVVTGRFHFDGDPVLTWMISNVVAHLDNKDNIYPKKERFENKIDGAVALIMALYRMTVNENGPSIYSNAANAII